MINDPIARTEALIEALVQDLVKPFAPEQPRKLHAEMTVAASSTTE